MKPAIKFEISWNQETNISHFKVQTDHRHRKLHPETAPMLHPVSPFRKISPILISFSPKKTFFEINGCGSQTGKLCPSPSLLFLLD